ncbi:flagellin [Halovivax gelatinilyticus]|uniref:flagellin n=1 Tax=Halovivax gelatinilyticus TaxID=2961597 RepID=UPI0020CA8FDC|nr:flagellin [Halovivax gelatinilyticus]
MGFSTSAAVAILFIGLFVAVGIAFPAFESAYERQSAAMDDRDDRALEIRNTAIDVDATNDEPAETLTVNVTNEGSTTLDVAAVDLLLDGAYVSSEAYATAVGEPDASADAGRTIVQPGERLQITVEERAEAPDRLKVVTGSGVAQTLTEVDVDGE